MKLSDCKTFADIQSFCDGCKGGETWWVNEEGNLSSTNVDSMEFYFDSVQRCLMWRFARDTVGRELYNNEYEAVLEVIRQAIQSREQSIAKMTMELEELKREERGHVAQFPLREIDMPSWLEAHGFKKSLDGDGWEAQIESTVIFYNNEFVRVINNKTGKQVSSVGKKDIREALRECQDGFRQMERHLHDSVNDIESLMD